MIEKEVTIVNKLGLHARATAKLVSLASRFRARITVTRNNRQADAKNMMAVLLLGAGKGTILRLSADGEDESEALAAIIELIARRFDESE
ncbi:MAG TPA: HPr family phosphocarrier protein [Terriglobales bacterium]|nr:HPr family phosphocarrier protein [Terriglobales bacterium]